ncbi:MAG: NADH-quinone oxidoreductase subunit A [Pyrobaculum sp.]|uniref:NADH-quinone oxidoreductase subunit A n=1 Tax=Pyrobaculum sp. TaxID=2004705 RepID=UPI003EEFFF30
MVGFLVFLGVLAVALVGLVVLGYLLAPRRPSEVKERRFETGGPPFGEVKRKLVVQYIGYIYLVTAVEALVGLMIVAALANTSLELLAVSIALVLLPVLVLVAVSIKLLSDIRRWG